MTENEKLEMQNDALKRRIQDMRPIVNAVSKRDVDSALKYLKQNGVTCREDYDGGVEVCVKDFKIMKIWVSLSADTIESLSSMNK
jgi:regulator of replication initiation timing